MTSKSNKYIRNLISNLYHFANWIKNQYVFVWFFCTQWSKSCTFSNVFLQFVTGQIGKLGATSCHNVDKFGSNLAQLKSAAHSKSSAAHSFVIISRTTFALISIRTFVVLVMRQFVGISIPTFVSSHINAHIQNNINTQQQQSNTATQKYQILLKNNQKLPNMFFEISHFFMRSFIYEVQKSLLFVLFFISDFQWPYGGWSF